MKKPLSLICALILVLSFSACNPSQPADPPPSTDASIEQTTATKSQSEPVAEDAFADLSHLPEAKRQFFQKLGFTPSSLRTAFSGDAFISTAHRGVVSVYTGDLFGNDKKKEAIVISLLDAGDRDRIQANYFYYGEEGIATEVLLSAPLDYTYHPGHQAPPTLFLYRYGGKTYFVCQKYGGNEWGGGSFAHYGLIYTEILPDGKIAPPVSLEYGHGAGQHWYAAVSVGDEVISSSEDVYGDDGSYEKEVSFNAINERLKEIGLPVLGDTREEVFLVDVSEKTPGVTMLVSGSIAWPEDGSFSDGTWKVEYIDHLKYD